MLDLSTTYLGLHLKNPVVPSSSPLMKSLDNIKRLEDAGAPALILHSLFEEQLIRERDTLDYFLAYGTESFSEAPTFFPNLSNYNFGPQGYLEHIRKIKNAVKIPVIASLNGFSPGGWIGIAQQIEQAGADAIELNMYYIAADYEQDSPQVEDTYLHLLRDIKASVKIPISVKLGDQFTAFANFARRLDKEGANGLVLFNRFYQPDLDLENLNVVPDLELSTPYEMRLRLRWIAILYGSVECDLAVTGGVHSAEDVLKCMMTGANAAMMTSALLLNGIGHLKKVLTDLREWMDKHEYESIKQMRGSMSQKSVSQPAAYERANYMRVLQSYNQNHTTL
jgi:dihydroorotate dehydrogenase (fumarate)